LRNGSGKKNGAEEHAKEQAAVNSREETAEGAPGTLGQPAGDVKEEPAESAGKRDDETELPEEERLKAELEDMRRQLEEQKEQAQNYFNQLARMKADFENLRRRSQKEKDEIVEYASEQLVKLLLPVLDNFERALADESGDFGKFKEGVKMIYDQIYEILSKEGLKPIPAKGEEFDPEKHEAVMSEKSPECPDNTVLEELRKGYTFKGKVIRPAMVKVAKSPD